MKTHFLKYLPLCPLVLSIGPCWHLNAECLAGKWCAVLVLWIMVLGANCALAKDLIRYRHIFIPVALLLAWCQTVDLLSDCWNTSHLLWATSLVATFALGHRIAPGSFQRQAFLLTVFMLIGAMVPYLNLSIPLSLQLFDNPAGEAAALVMGWACALPWMFEVCHHRYGKRSFYGYTAFFLLIFFLVVTVLYIHSRTGFLAIVISSAVYLLGLFKRSAGKRNMVLWTLGSIAVLCMTTAHLYGRNVASADGRMLTYRVMWTLFKQRPLCGWGTNAIDAHYMAAQAHVLQTYGENSPFCWLAGDVVRPFNELLAWMMQYGLVGSVLAMVIFWMFWKSCDKQHRLWSATICTGWCVLGTFSYPSYYPYACLLTVMAMGICTRSGVGHEVFGKARPAWCNLLVGFIGCGAILLSAERVYHENCKDQWMEMIAEDGTQALEGYGKVQNSLTEDADASYAYAAALNFDGQIQKSLAVLQSLEGRLQNYDTELLAGDDELTLHHWQAAVQHFNMAHHMVPVRFMPLYGLMQTYMAQGDICKARSLARQILDKPVKIPSEDVAFVKDEAARFLKVHP